MMNNLFNNILERFRTHLGQELQFEWDTELGKPSLTIIVPRNGKEYGAKVIGSAQKINESVPSIIRSFINLFKTEEIEIEGQKVLIAGADEMDKSQLDEIKAWQKERAIKSNKEKEQRKASKTIKPIDAFRELKERQAYNKKKNETGHGRIF